ncbi:FecR family protein [Marinifilum sp.]|uniref:FecR family protein n=1 Tax=Marinifilum sp. TaxID=2033137 RepID=UPI003BABF999
MESLKKYISKASDWSKGILFGELDISEMKTQDAKDFKELQSGEYANWRQQVKSLFNKEQDWKSLQEQINSMSSQSKIIRFVKYWQSAAAILLLAVLIYGGYFIYHDMQTPNYDGVLPGRSMAYLQIGNQQRIELADTDTLIVTKGSRVQLESGKLIYSKKEAVKENNEYVKMSIPRNAEYKAVLSDGTKVWMNSETEIGHKVLFDIDKRLVDLQGEAYFEVAKDANRPFVVRTSNMNIKVMGTHFNLKAYPNEDYTYATLNEGKVRVFKGEMQEDLLPNQQLILNNASKEYSTKAVDASIFSAWTKGKFLYKNERLEVILSSLSRWYDLKVFYENPILKDDRYSIRVNRYDDIEILLNHLELTGGLEFEVNNEVLVVK